MAKPPLAADYIAEERATQIAQAIAQWKRIARNGAEVYPWRGSKIFWQPAFGYWAFFGQTAADTPLGWRYWNTFGTTPADFRKNMLVEINPPQSGPAGGTQGLIATAPDGTRWILHGGRLHPPGLRITADMFAVAAASERVTVRFSDGRRLPYFPVARLDGDPALLHEALANFVETCQRVRLYYGLGAREADAERRVQEAELGSAPERRGSYVIPARAETLADRVHADIWRALANALTARGIAHNNNRVGRYGPDLRTTGKQPALFEIKTDMGAHALYEGLGQLLLYERLLGQAYRKFLVLPGPATPALGAAISDMGINILKYARKGRGYGLDDAVLDRLFGARRSASAS